MEDTEIGPASAGGSDRSESPEPVPPTPWTNKYPWADFFEAEISFESDEVDTDAIETRVQQLVQSCDVSKGYCSRCGYLLSHWPALDSGSEWEYTVGQTYTTEEIEASSRCGCKMCGFLWSRLVISDRLHRFRRIEARLAALGRPGRCSLSIQNWGKSIAQLIWLNIPGVEATHCNFATASVVQATSFPLPISSNVWEELPDPVELANSWISECRESHADCRPLWKYHDGPRRLIRISDDVVRLVESDSWDETPEYATLSYSWGSVPFTKLTRETLSSFLCEIPFETLPKTFHDAIRLARMLGLSYIWIDALCIIQDAENQEDWLKESGRMDCIYGGSQVTLSASSALDAFQGFFPRTPKYNGGFVARIQTDKTCRVYNFSSSVAYEEAVIESYLGSRGWTLQEKLLSRRTLHIGDRGVFWECQSTTESQFIPKGLTNIIQGRRLVRPENLEWPWDEIINIYSRTNLTVESDRLPALSGIAARQNAITGDQYLAGFWKKGIVISLTWVCASRLAKRPSWRAPTWSWASIHGACWAKEYAYEAMKPQARLLDGWTKTVTDNPFGAVLDGEITLACASLVRAKLDRTGIEEYCHRWWQTNLERLGSKAFPHVVFPDFESRTFSVGLDCLDVEMQGKQEDVVLLPLFCGFSGLRTQKNPERRKGDGPSSTLEAATSEDEADETRILTEKADNSGVEEDFEYLPNGECWRKENVIEGMVLRVVPGVVGHYTRLGQFSFDNDLNHKRGRNFYKDMSSIVREKGAETARLGCIFAGHSFGSATMYQLLKSTYYADRPELAEMEKPLFRPAEGSAIRKQVTEKTVTMLLDMWCMPLLGPNCAPLFSLPLPLYDDVPSAAGGNALLAVESEAFFKWKEHLNIKARLLSPNPSAKEVVPTVFERPSGIKLTEPNFFYVENSAHLNQSDFGVLFPWLTKKIFSAEQPERALRLNLRAQLQLFRANGIPIARTCFDDLIDGSHIDKLDVKKKDGDAVETEDGLHNDKAIFDRSANNTVECWNWIDIIGLGDMKNEEETGKTVTQQVEEAEEEMKGQLEPYEQTSTPAATQTLSAAVAA